MKQTMMNKALAAAAGLLLFAGCKKDGEHNDGEVITAVVLRFTPQGGGNMLTFEVSDQDGPGGNAPVAQEISLPANKQFDVAVSFLDKSKNPAVDITEEVEEEGEAHRIYYQPSAGSNISIGSLNNDADGIALGTRSVWTTAAAGNGQVKLTLRHYAGNPANKAAADAVDSPKSSTDVEVTFPTKVAN